MIRLSKLLSTAALLAAALLAAPQCVHAQDEPAAGFEGLVEVSEVLLDVLALDKKGNVVRGLGPDDFLVVENGELVELTGVSFYTTRYGEDAEAGPVPDGGAPEIPASRFFILFFHHQPTASSILTNHRQQIMKAGRTAHNWVRDAMSPSDWAAVVSHNGSLAVYQDFTQDRDSLLAAVAEATRGRRVENPKPSQWKREAAASHFSLRRGLPTPPDLRPETRRIYDALRLVAEATRPIVGRKNLLLYTLGFGQFDDITLDSYPDPRHYPAMQQSLNDTNVALYPMDMTHRDVFSSQARFLLQIALDAGGIYLSNRVSFKSRLERIGRENLGYYLLSFRATHPAGESGYRSVRVGTKDRRIRIRAQRGYRYGL